jgi:hypothetical protein
MAYVDIANASRSTIFRDKLMVAIAKAAGDILNEDPITPNHTARKLLATKALQYPTPIVERAIWVVLQNPVVQAAGENATDNDIQFVVNSVWDQLTAG